MKILVIGANQVGLSVVESLAEDRQNQITLVDPDRKQLRAIHSRLDVNCVAGNACHPDVLLEAGAQDADLLLALTLNDEKNILACRIANLLFKPSFCIASVRAQAYHDTPNLLNAENLGVDLVIDPEQAIIDQIVQIIIHPGVIEYYHFADAKVCMAGVLIDRNNPLLSHTLQRVYAQASDSEFYITAFFREGKLIEAHGDTQLAAGDELLVVAKKNTIEQALKDLGHPIHYRRKILIAGAGRIGTRLAQLLEKRHFQVVLVEKDAKQADIAEEKLAKSVVIHGEAGDRKLLRDHDIQKSELFCAVTNVDDVNIMSSMLAQAEGCKRIITLVKSREYYQILTRHRLLDNVISPIDATLGAIMAHIHQSDMIAAQPIHLGGAEVVETMIHGEKNSSQVVGQKLSSLKLPKHTCISAIVRDGQVLLPKPERTLMSHDHVILFVGDKRDIRTVEKLFSVNPKFF